MTLGDFKSRLRVLELRLYEGGRLVAEKPTPQRDMILKRTAEAYEALARRSYRLGIAPGEW